MFSSVRFTRLAVALGLVAALVACGTAPPTGGSTSTLEPGGAVVHESGTAALAPDGSFTGSIDLTIEPVDDPTATVPLPAGVEAVGNAFGFTASAGIAANPGSAFVVALVVPPGEDPDGLAIAVLERDNAYASPAPPDDEASDLPPSWIVLDAAYDAESRLLLAPVLAFTPYGWDAIVVRSEAHETLTTTAADATIAGQQAGADFVGACGPGFGGAPEDCDIDDRTLAATMLEDAYDELTGFGFTTTPRLERALVAISFDAPSWSVDVVLGPYRIELRPASAEIAAGMYSTSTGRIWLAIGTNGLTEGRRPTVRHEYVHATQYGYGPTTTSTAEWLRSRWVIEGQAVLLQGDYANLVRNGRAVRAVDDSLERSRWTGSAWGPLPSSEYQAQDFWVYLANRFGHGDAPFLEPFMAEGVRAIEVDRVLRREYPADFGAAGLAGGLSLAYWEWVKNQVFQKEVAPGSAVFGAPCTFTPGSATPTVIAYDPSSPPSSASRSLPPLTSHVYRIDLAAAGGDPYVARFAVQSSSSAVRSTFFPAVPASASACFGQADAGARDVVVDGGALSHYVLVSNTSRSVAQDHTLAFPDARTVAITSPSDGASSDEGVAVFAEAVANGFADPRITWTWRRPLDGAFFTFGTTGSGEPIQLPTLCDGDYVLEAEAREGFTGTAVSTSIDLTIDDLGATNPPPACAPEVAIEAPIDGGTYASGEAIALAASITNDSPPATPRYVVEWRTGGPGGPLVATGLDAVLAAGFSAGSVVLHVSYGAASDQATITVVDSANTPPSATITDPPDGSSYSFLDPGAGLNGVTVTVSGEGSSPEEGALTGASLTWELRQTVPSLTAWTAQGTGSEVDVELRYASCTTQTFEIRLTATDSQDLFDTDTIEVFLTPPFC